MRKILIAILAALSLTAHAQEKATLEKPHVDKRVELLSIVSRLAGAPEYSSKTFKTYTDRIEQHFEEYKNHELIQFTKSIGYVRYDSPAWIALCLDDNLQPLTNVNEVWLKNSRWLKQDVEKFIPLLQQFAKDSKFDDFFNANTDLYAETVERILPVYEQVDLRWYRTFFGKESSETFSIIVGIGNGRNNYGPTLDFTTGSRKAYAIMGAGSMDSEGMPKFDKAGNSFLILLHEFNHSFVNYLIKKNQDALRESGEKIFSAVKSKMVRQAYSSWEFVLNEALVRAGVIKYCKDHDAEPSKVENLVKQEKNSGFLWIEELVAELENYDKQRGKYPTLESYMPKIVEAYKIWAEKIQPIPIDESKRPVVVSISELTNGDTNVSADIKTITANFSKPLSGGNSYSVYAENESDIPQVKGVKFTNNNQSFVMEVSLERDKEYHFVYTGEGFVSADGIGIKDYEVKFKTEK